MTAALTLTMEDRKALAIQQAESQYQELRRKWLSERTPEQLALIAANEAKPRPLTRALSIEKERTSVVIRSQCPYTGVKLWRW
ncbi:hypothetical protein [Aeromonas caviae]|uniref:hypothetical protein n=1 Tax=Aeromonas caviae TaxID=648 RepID=UPI00244D0EEA|nr:hypothetical protein [Aeromonas caviae]MDH1221094.1 hypothetical protein [Aeromonas caviae]